MILQWQANVISNASETNQVIELAPELWYCACSLIDLVCCDTSRSETIVGHTCVDPLDDCCDTHL